MTKLDMLNMHVTKAIWIAEHAPKDTELEKRAWREVSEVEEEIASILPATNVEGRIARRGAVRAALAAEDRERAQRLFEQYRNETTTDANLRLELETIMQ